MSGFWDVVKAPLSWSFRLGERFGEAFIRGAEKVPTSVMIALLATPGWLCLALPIRQNTVVLVVAIAEVIAAIYAGFNMIGPVISEESTKGVFVAVAGFLAFLSAYLSVWALIYRHMFYSDALAFHGMHGRLDAAYFTLTTFSTTGFGDIYASSHIARIAVTANLVSNLIVLGGGVTLLLGLVVARLVELRTGPIAEQLRIEDPSIT